MASLCLVSKALHSSTAPQLYKSVVLHARDEENLSDLKTECFSLGFTYLKYTREIMLVANFHQVLRYRCHDIDSDSDNEIDTSEDDDVASDSSEEQDTSHQSQGCNANTNEQNHAPDYREVSPEDNAASYGASVPHAEWTHGLNGLTGADKTNAWDVLGEIRSDTNRSLYLMPHEEFLEALGSKLQQFLDLIPEGCLRKFR